MTNEVERLAGTGVLWEGLPIQVQRIQDMLGDFEVAIAQRDLRLLIIPWGAGDPVVINLGDEVVLGENDQFGVIRTTEDHHGDAGTA